jgi:hypothetical protein
MMKGGASTFETNSASKRPARTAHSDVTVEGTHVEDARFDRLARAVAGMMPRRSALRGLAASGAAALALVGSGLAGMDDPVAAAKKGRRKKQCNNANGCKKPKNPCKKAVCRHHKCRRKNRRDGTSCGDEQICRGGKCGSACNPACTGGQICQQAACVCTTGECTVTPSRLGGWVEVLDDDHPAGGVNFVSGPEDPPLGTGSAQFSTPTGKKAALANPAYDGLAIADLETLAYETFMQDGSTTGVVVPAIKLPVLFGASNAFTTLIFEPTYSENSDVVANEWQSWDALSDDARWWSSKQLPNDICAFDCFVPWSEILAAIPDATITGGLLLETGSGTPDAVGNVDALQVNDTTFNFEPDA